MHRLAAILPALGLPLEMETPTPDRSVRPDGVPRWVVWTPAPGVELTGRVVQTNPRAARIEWAERVRDGGVRRLEYRRRWVPLRRLAPWRAPAL